MKFAITPFAARQFVNHGHCPGERQARQHPSYQVRDNDVIEVKEKSKQLAVVLDAAQSGERDVPEYLEVDHRAMKGRFARAPEAVGRALPGADGTQPGRRILLALTPAPHIPM